MVTAHSIDLLLQAALGLHAVDAGRIAARDVRLTGYIPALRPGCLANGQIHDRKPRI